MPRNTFPETLWAGSENSLNLAVEVHDRALAGQIKADAYPSQDDEEPKCPDILEMMGSVGVIKISGSLRPTKSWYDAWVGVTSYEAIREALVYAANDAGVQHIVLDINSGGGSVAGCSDTGRLIREISDKVKPITAFTDGSMCSAAYWLGCSASKVYASETAITGSIGVLAVHQEYSKMMEMEGITATVVRAGTDKALVNPYEPLTEKARANLQSQLDATYKIFVSHVADMRSMSYAVADNSANGKEYMGVQALDAGLVDGIKNFDQVMSQILDTLEKSANTQTHFNQGGTNMPRVALTEQHIAAIAAGAVIEGTTEMEAPNGVQGQGQEGQVDSTDTIVDGEGSEAQSNPQTESEGEGVAAPEADSAIVGFLQASLKDKDNELLAVKMEVQKLNDQVASMKATHEGLVAVAAGSVKTMKVALGHSGFDASSLTAEALLAEHAATSEVFKASFKVGQISAVSSDAPEQPKAKAAVDPVYLARVNAAKHSK